MGLQKRLRETFCLLAEEEIAAVVERSFGIGPGRFCRKAPQLADLVLAEKVRQVIVDPDVYQPPVIQPSAFDSLV